MAARDHANNTMIKNNQALQSEYMKKQDQSLAILADGVDRLDDMAKGINDEIRQQDAYVFVLFQMVSMVSNGFKWFQMVSNGFCQVRKTF